MSQDAQRPTMATVFGMLNIFFGAYSINGLLNIKNAFSFLGLFYGIISLLSGLILLLLLVAGVYLIMNKKRAIILTMCYVYASLVVTVVAVVYLFVEFGIASVIDKNKVAAVLVGIIYPLLLLFILLRNAEVKSFYSAQE
jgi:hypothetical protein